MTGAVDLRVPDDEFAEWERDRQSRIDARRSGRRDTTRPNTQEPRRGAADTLAEMLELDKVGLTITGARIVGRGSTASADLHLSDGSEITFSALRDFANPTRLAVELAACAGATPRLKAPQAVQALALLREIAEHHQAFTADQIAFDWGASYLQSADVLDVDMDDQQARWAAFSLLADRDPKTYALNKGVGLPSASIVLRQQDDVRLVRCGWYRDAIRAQDPSVGPQELAHRMERVGWTRRGGTGRIKATRPGGHGHLGWTFYLVPAGWEDR